VHHQQWGAFIDNTDNLNIECQRQPIIAPKLDYVEEHGRAKKFTPSEPGTTALQLQHVGSKVRAQLSSASNFFQVFFSGLLGAASRKLSL
jgi:hypothetical protein